MTLDQLRVFVTVADLQHVTRAAAQLCLTQSAVSSAISALESRHGVTLFHRVGRRIELTSEGTIFLETARLVLAQAQDAETLLSDLGAIRRGTLTLFASQTIANFWLPDRLVKYNSLYSEIDLTIRTGNTTESADAVFKGTAELGLIEGETYQAGLVVELVATDKLVIVVGNAHRWATTTPSLPDEMKATRWALREKGSGTRSSFEGTLTKLGLSSAELSVVMELPSNEALCAIAAAGDIATVVSASVARAGIDAGKLCAIPFDLGMRQFRLIRHRERSLSRAARAFIDLLRTRDSDRR